MKKENTCGIIIPTFDGTSPGTFFQKRYPESLECILHEHHGGITAEHDRAHLIHLPDGRYICWWYDQDCTSCREAEAEDDCECFIWNEMKEEDAKAVIEKGDWDEAMTKKFL
jgi:hypothetical protein